ncbi:unnamed protein product [Echinostoma caproni]|uniref:Uncharacterized protein n=1 Tax=Echinostoma caproni TaxID=27848 RepID=A0A3P8GL02_9TREM|nr:unnamed protein product [Echinostoma caproni]
MQSLWLSPRLSLPSSTVPPISVQSSRSDCVSVPTGSSLQPNSSVYATVLSLLESPRSAPLKDVPAFVSAAGLVPGETRATVSGQLEDELEAEATRQVVMAARLEQAAKQAAHRAETLQDLADEAKLRAFEAVAEGEALANRERALQATAREQAHPLQSLSEKPSGLDVLLDKKPRKLRKRDSLVHGPTNFPDPEDASSLEALRVLYLQRLLSDPERREPRLSGLLDTSDRLVFVPSPSMWTDHSPEAREDTDMKPLRKLLFAESAYEPDNGLVIPERILASSALVDDEDEDDNGYFDGFSN